MTEAITIFDLLGRSRKIWIDDEGRIVTRANVIDEDGDSLDVNEDGSINIVDEQGNRDGLDSFSLLNRILKELKIMNLHLSLMTDHEIKHTEVEDG